MPITLTFYKISERKPEHQQEIIWLKNVDSFGAEGFSPKYIKVEYTWITLNENGEEDGGQIWYDPKSQAKVANARLAMLFDGYEPQDDWLWIPESEYWESLGFEEISLEERYGS